jgi:hypothetical protein
VRAIDAIQNMPHPYSVDSGTPKGRPVKRLPNGELDPSIQ